MAEARETRSASVGISGVSDGTGFSLLKRMPLALLAGAVFPLGLSPYEVWPCILISVAGLFWLIQGTERRNMILIHYAFGTGFYGVGVSWVYFSIHDFGGASPLLAGLLVLLFVLALALVFALQGWLLSFLGRRWLWLSFACLWFAREWFVSWFLTGFPWLYAGYGMIDTWYAALAPLTGVLMLGFIVVVLAVQIVLMLQAAWLRSVPGLVLPLVLIGTVTAMSFGLQFYSPVSDTGRVLTVSLVQGNVDQATKWSRAMVRPILNRYLGLSETEWGRDLIVWPEAAVTVFREQAGGFLGPVGERATAAGSALLLGIPDRDAEGHFLNSATVAGNGSGTYHKRRLVPFGEYVPLESLLRGVIQFFDLPMSHNVAGPAGQAPLFVGELPLSLSICYEVVYPDLVRATVADPALFVTISNDTWFGTSIGPWQHLQMARMRALENGRYMVRATNNGVTAVIDDRGRIQAQLPQFEPGVLRGEVRVMEGTTLYNRTGQLPWLILIAGMILLIGYRGRARQDRR